MSIRDMQPVSWQVFFRLMRFNRRSPLQAGRRESVFKPFAILFQPMNDTAVKQGHIYSYLRQL